MIDVENEVYSTVAKALRARFPKLFMSGGEAQPSPSDFPAAVGREMDNSTYARSLDSSGEENHATLMWQWDAYSNKASGRKAECKAIISEIDKQMSKLGFLRVGSIPSEGPNASPQIYRMIARYRAVVSKNKIIYRS